MADRDGIQMAQNDSAQSLLNTPEGEESKMMERDGFLLDVETIQALTDYYREKFSKT